MIIKKESVIEATFVTSSGLFSLILAKSDEIFGFHHFFCKEMIDFMELTTTSCFLLFDFS